MGVVETTNQHSRLRHDPRRYLNETVKFTSNGRVCLPSLSADTLPSTGSSHSSQAMLHEDAVPPTMTMVLGMGPKLMVKSAVERNLPPKAREDYTSNEVSQLCADGVEVIMRSGVLYDEVMTADIRS